MFVLSMIFAGILGVIGWTFAEYSFHRFDGHSRIKWGLIGPMHKEHHRNMNAFEGEATPLWITPVFFGITLSLGWLFGVFYASIAFGITFYATFRYYVKMHRDLHDIAPASKRGEWARRHHFYHHFKDPYANFGVTTDFWDRLFGTHVKVEQALRVPRAKALPWLLDEVGEMKSEYATHYTLVGRARRSKASRQQALQLGEADIRTA